MTNGFYPRAIIKNIPPGANDPAIVPRLAILHVAVSKADSLYNYFNGPSGGVESHFYVRFDGTVEQYRSIYLQADANLDANDFAVSIETAGMGDGEWTPAQLASIKRLLVWLHRAAGIPLRPCKAWNGDGVGYHVMFGAPSHWTPSVKTCPGPDRIKQFNNVLLPWMAARSATLDVGTWNLKAGRNADTVRREVKALLDGEDLDVLLLQEADQYDDQLATIRGWKLVASTHCGTAIMVRAGIPLHNGHVKQLGYIPWPFRKRLHVPRQMPSVVVSWLRVASNHGLPNVGTESPAARARLYASRAGAKRIIAWANRRNVVPLLIGGDWNRPVTATGPATPAGIAAAIKGRIHKGAHFDFFISRKCGVANVRVLDNFGGSDHPPVIATVARGV